MASNGTRNKHVITRAIFDFPCALKALKSFVAVDWRVSSLFKRYLGVRIKRSCLRIYRELVSEKFSLQFSRKCVTPSERNRVFSLPCGDLKTLSRVISPSCSELSLSRKPRFPSGSENFFRESQNSLRGAYNLLRVSQNSFRRTSKLLWEAYNNATKESTVLGREKLA